MSWLSELKQYQSKSKHTRISAAWRAGVVAGNATLRRCDSMRQLKRIARIRTNPNHPGRAEFTLKLA